LFRILGREVRCVVLNACYSAAQAGALVEHVDVVIGMTSAIKDQAAIAFASAFYQALGYGESVQAAFELGKNRIELEGLSGADVPTIATRKGIDAASIRFASPRAVTAPKPAPDARTLRWLHISDLHLGSEDGYGHDIVLQA